MVESKAIAKYIRVQPSKVRIMARNIINDPVESAINKLTFSPNKSAKLLLKVLNSAVANATHNDNMNPDKLIVAKVFADSGPHLKRWRPRAQGRATPILKRTSHITVVVKESN